MVEQNGQSDHGGKAAYPNHGWCSLTRQENEQDAQADEQGRIAVEFAHFGLVFHHLHVHRGKNWIDHQCHKER